MSERNKIKEINDLINDLDIQSLCNSLNFDTYSQDLVSEKSYCARGLDENDPQCPYSAFLEFINGSNASPCFIIGCSGVGKSSFLEFYKKEVDTLLVYDLNKEDLSSLSTVKVHKHFAKELIKIITKFDEKTMIELLFHSLKKIPTNIAIKNAENDFAQMMSGKLIKTDNIINILHICLNNLTSTGDEDDYSIFINTVSTLMYERELISHKIILSIDNIDRRGDPGLESKAVKSVIPFCNRYLDNRCIRIVIPIRRLTFERYPKHLGGFIFKKMTPSKIYLRPPSPISLFIAKMLRSEFPKHLFHKRALINNGQVTVTGEQFQYLLIYIYLFLYRKDSDRDNNHNLLISFANESAREIIRLVLNYIVYDYSDIIRKYGGRTSILDIIPDLCLDTFSLLPNKEEFEKIFENSAEYSNGSATKFAIIEYLNNVVKNDSRIKPYVLSDQHLLSILMRHKYKDYNPECEGTTADYEKLINKHPELKMEYHQNLFPVPIINLFNSRFTKETYNNILRYMIFSLCHDNNFKVYELKEVLLSIGIKSHHVDESIKLILDKHYFIGDKFEYIDYDKDAIIKLTKKGEMMFKIITWPRYINIISKSTKFYGTSTILSPDSDVSHKNIITFIKLLIESEKSFFNSINNDCQILFNKLFRKNKEKNSNSLIPTMFPESFFVDIICNVQAMLSKRQVSNANKKFNDFKKGILNISYNLGYSNDSIEKRLNNC